ncbi:hypothetical protein EDC96DRAFT_565610 [Choanephora cucurbitarum]|nr:hypothetical protein EDC96DRAFT_565610 [Choanephora cucurbitarum]
MASMTRQANVYVDATDAVRERLALGKRSHTRILSEPKQLAMWTKRKCWINVRDGRASRATQSFKDFNTNFNLNVSFNLVLCMQTICICAVQSVLGCRGYSAFQTARKADQSKRSQDYAVSLSLFLMGALTQTMLYKNKTIELRFAALTASYYSSKASMEHQVQKFFVNSPNKADLWALKIGRMNRMQAKATYKCFDRLFTCFSFKKSQWAYQAQSIKTDFCP